MNKQTGSTFIKLIIVTVIMIVLASVAVNYGKNIMKEVEIQDLRTNMLYIQAQARKGLEEVCFQTVNMDESKQEDLDKINEIKQKNLYGIVLSNIPTEIQNKVQNITGIILDETYYYLDEKALNEMGIKDIQLEENEYFIVKYNFENANVEVINTKGYEGNYTLTQLNQLIGE